jgi:hypothetical protein
MPYWTIRARAAWALAGTTGLVLTTLAAGSAYASPAAGSTYASPAAAAHARTGAPAASAARWVRVTPAGTNIIDDIGLARGKDGVLHVLWTTDKAPNQSVVDFPVGPGGKVGKRATIGRFFLATGPDATVTPAGLATVWNGIKTSTGEPEGTFGATRPMSGGRWTVGLNVPPLSGIPFTSSSDTTTTGSDGKPWVAFTGTDSLAVDHFGRPEVELGPVNRCCLIEPGMATDGHTGSTWVTFASDIKKRQGIFARRLQASGQPAGPAQLLPGSRARRGIVLPGQRVGTTARGKGRRGVYVAYAEGAPVPHALAVDKVGSRTPVRIAGFHGFTEQLGGDTITADPRGHLLVVWFFGHGTKPALFVRRSNLAATRYGSVKRIPLPPGTTTVWKVYANAQSARLDILALVTRKGNNSGTAYWHTQVVPPKG